MPHSTTYSPTGATTTATTTATTDATPDATTTTITVKEALPYWLVNVPPSEWPAECPEFLLNQTEKNMQVLSIPDEEYHRQSWDVVKEIIS